MKLWIGIAIAALLGSVGDGAKPSDKPPGVSGLMAKVQSFYDRTSYLTAEFEQEAIRARTGRKNLRSGKVRVLRPNKIRWDYRSPEPVHYVADGEILWVYQPQDALVYRMGLEQGGLDLAVRFLAGGVRLAEKFEGKVVPAPEGLGQSNTLFLELMPKDEMVALRKLVIGVDALSGAVLISILVDPDGNQVRTSYRDIQDDLLEKSIFAFEPPPGVKVEDLRGKSAGRSPGGQGSTARPSQVSQ